MSVTSSWDCQFLLTHFCIHFIFVTKNWWKGYSEHPLPTIEHLVLKWMSRYSGGTQELFLVVDNLCLVQWHNQRWQELWHNERSISAFHNAAWFSFQELSSAVSLPAHIRAKHKISLRTGRSMPVINRRKEAHLELLRGTHRRKNFDSHRAGDTVCRHETSCCQNGKHVIVNSP